MANTMKIIFLAIILALSSFSINAATINELNALGDISKVKLYIHGVGEGYSWSNAFLAATNKKELFCPPEKLILNADNYYEMYIKEIKDHNLKSSTQVEAIIGGALLRTFPCSKK